MEVLKPVIQSTRGPFLLLTPVCILLAVSTVVASGIEIHYGYLGLALLGGLLAHISVNTLNEYQDFKSGLDLTTQKTPFSGGSGALPAHPEAAGYVLAMAVACFIGVVLIGIYFLLIYGMQLLPIGLLGLATIVLYTGWFNRHALLCLIAPGLGFGIFMVLGTQFVLVGEYSRLAVVVSLVPFFLVNNLLLLNQFPDIHADIAVGRRHFPIRFGTRASSFVFACFLFSALMVILIGVFLSVLPLLSIIAVLPLLLALLALAGALTHEAKIGQFPKFLAANVAATLLTPLVLAISLFVA